MITTHVSRLSGFSLDKQINIPPMVWKIHPVSTMLRIAERCPHQRILVGVTTTASGSGRRRAIRETWLQDDSVGGITCLFFVEGTKPCLDEPNVIVLGEPKNCDTVAICQIAIWALDNMEFDWLLVCDDSSYIDLSRLKEKVGNKFSFIEAFTTKDQPLREVIYLAPKCVVESFVKKKLLDPLRGWESSIPTPIPAIQWFSRTAERFPAESNKLIACGGCEDWKLRQIHRLRTARHIVRVQAEHPHWEDSILLSSDGYFCRATTECEGRWTRSDDGVVNLFWARWGLEHLIPFGERQGRDPLNYLCTRDGIRTLTVLLQGGLGNQMFQYAHALALSRRLAALLRVVFVERDRPYGLDRFGVQLESGYPAEVDKFEDYEGRQLERDWPSFCYFTRSPAKHFLLGGEFQNENYFLPVADEIREIFRVEPLRPTGTDDRNLVVIHVRRGDFVGSHIHDLCTPRYYAQAIGMMRTLIQDPVFMVVSDDPSWCRENFTLDDGIKFWPMHKDRDDMAVMVAADALILSNSTFAWWAAWLGKGGPVIAPEPYVSGRSWEIVPPRWIRIPASGVSSIPHDN